MDKTSNPEIVVETVGVDRGRIKVGRRMRHGDGVLCCFPFDYGKQVISFMSCIMDYCGALFGGGNGRLPSWLIFRKNDAKVNGAGIGQIFII